MSFAPHCAAGSVIWPQQLCLCESMGTIRIAGEGLHQRCGAAVAAGAPVAGEVAFTAHMSSPGPLAQTSLRAGRRRFGSPR